MRRKYFRFNNEYFEFINKYKNEIEIYELTFTKTRLIRLSYDIM